MFNVTPTTLTIGLLCVTILLIVDVTPVTCGNCRMYAGHCVESRPLTFNGRCARRAGVIRMVCMRIGRRCRCAPTMVLAYDGRQPLSGRFDDVHVVV